MSKLSAVDLYSGAGGFALGLHEAGISCIGAIEVDRFAALTFRQNHPNTPILERDITEFTTADIKSRFGGVDIVVAGPPCQGFSVAGPSQYRILDDRNNLVMEIGRFVQCLRPQVCVVENVRGLLHGKLPNKIKALDSLRGQLESSGYNVSYQVLQAADFGVPQWRQRLFVFAVRSKRPFPRIAGRFGTLENPWRTVSQAIEDLPIVSNGEGSDGTIPYDRAASCEYQATMRDGSAGVTNHVSMVHTTRIVERFRHIPVGGSLVDVPPEYGQRLRNGRLLDAKNRFKMNNQRLDPDKVSLAITASFQSNFVHPFLHRNLTAREGARLQSFPDRFIFRGPRTLMSRTLLMREQRHDEIGLSQYNQIGNAVPPLLASEIGRAVARYLNG